MPQAKIRIRLKGYDHQQVDKSARDIVETAERTGATITGPVPLPTEKNVYCVIRSPMRIFCCAKTSLAFCLSYLMMSVTTPAPTVRPPSRIAKRRP